MVMDFFLVTTIHRLDLIIDSDVSWQTTLGMKSRWTVKKRCLSISRYKHARRTRVGRVYSHKSQLSNGTTFEYL